MNRRIGLLTFITFAAVSAGHLNAQNNSGTDLRVISTAYITKIDEKKMRLVVKSDPEAPTVAVGTGTAPRGGGGGRRGGGVNVSGGGSRGGGRRGGSSPAPTTTAPTGTTAPASKGHEFKVSVTKETVVTDGDAPLPFSKLKVGDHVVISGISKGNDVEAESIQLDSQK
jgi:hypothetical protein